MNAAAPMGTASNVKRSTLLPGWHIVEIPAMAAAGRKFFQDDRLTFYDDLDTAVSQFENLHLIVAQCVLQYMPDPLQTLEALPKLGFTYVYITRTLVGDGIDHPIITKQLAKLSAHGLGVFPNGFTDIKTSHHSTIVLFDAIASRISVGYSAVAYQFAGMLLRHFVSPPH